MKFVVRDINGGFGDVTDYDWTLVRNDGSEVCRSIPREDGHGFRTEADTRSDIAAAKVSMKGARFAKVEVEDA